MSWRTTASEIREALDAFLRRIDDGDVNAAPASGIGHEFVIPQDELVDDEVVPNR